MRGPSACARSANPNTNSGDCPFWHQGARVGAPGRASGVVVRLTAVTAARPSKRPQRARASRRGRTVTVSLHQVHPTRVHYAGYAQAPLGLVAGATLAAL